MRLSMALKDKLMDLRLRDKLLAEGKITKAQLNEYLNSVQDDSSNAQLLDSVDSSANADAE